MSSIKSNFKGWFGEKMTAVGMFLSLDKSTYRRFHDVIINAPDGTTQIDHVIISPYGIFVLETKNMKGWIFGSEKGAKWTQSLYKQKHTFQNPLRQNYRHTKCLSEFLELPHEIMHSIVFFIGECKLKSRLPGNVMTSGVASYIKGFKDVILTDQQISDAFTKINALKNDKSLNNRAHLKSLEKRHSHNQKGPGVGSSVGGAQSNDDEAKRLYIFIDNEVMGPYTVREVGMLINEKNLSEDTQVCPEGSEQWVSLKDCMDCPETLFPL